MIQYNDSCKCYTRGEDDGDVTCWVHHDCSSGLCTHIDNDNDEPQDCGEV